MTEGSGSSDRSSTPRRPPFIYVPGSVLMHPPLVLQRSDLYGFFVKGDIDRMQRSVDATLNAGAGGKMRFKALTPYVLMSFTRIHHAFSERPVDHDKGWVTEVDIVTWVIVGRVEEVGGREKIGAVFYYPLHIWVDDAMALINGRELYGYPKYDCQYVMPEVGQPVEKLSLTVKSFQPMSPQTQIAWHPLVEINATGQGPDKPIGEFAELMEEALKLLTALPDFFALDAEGVRDVMGQLISTTMSQIFLKQLPDGTGDLAVYQAIVQAPARVDKLHGARLLGNEFKLRLHENGSFPLAQSLGLRLGEQDVLVPFNLYFDFTVADGEELVDNSEAAPEKIAILGGGVSSMMTAFFLTDQPGWQSRYDITLYQLGWRLGGKGASGRNAGYGQRIEEHGLHIWFGFYENAFAAIQKVYAELGRPAGAPLAAWDEAFKPHSYTVLEELIDGKWKTWPIDFPLKPGVPGTGKEVLTVWELAECIFVWIRKGIGDIYTHPVTRARPVAPPPRPSGLLARLRDKLVDGLQQEAEELADRLIDEVGEAIGDDVARIVARTEKLVTSLRDADGEQYTLAGEALERLRGLIRHRIDDILDHDDELRRLYILVDLGISALAGMIRDGVLSAGTFDVVNNIDFRDWLRKHGASEKYTIDSAPVRGFYDLVFAYVDGDVDKPNCEAGTMLRAMLRVTLLYEGGIMWKMQAGMGDTIFAPMYEVLRKRGVRFKYFHRVEELIPKDGVVDEIRMTQQVALKGEEYQPFVDVKGLPCWPSAPLLDQIVDEQAALLKQHDVDLESLWTPWPEIYEQKLGQPLPTLTLKKGKDFDRVVLGVSIGSLPWIAPKLLDASAPLRTTVDKVRTVVTQAYQLWINRPLRELGWRYWPESGEEPVLSGFVEPYDTWASMDQLLIREDWPAGADEPKSCAYFCSVMPCGELPPPSDHGFPQRMADLAKAGALSNLKTEMGWLWPQAAGIGKPGSFKYEWLVDPNGGTGEARFDVQYWRANIDPSEQYVLSLVDSSQHRLETDGSGFANLYLTGDWIRTGLNAGCVEAATMAGMQASRAISGYPRKIVGEKDS